LAGYALGINPFDQPDVEKSKKHTLSMLRELEAKNNLPLINIIKGNLNHELTSFLHKIKPHDYLAILSYLDNNDINQELLNAICLAIASKKNVPMIVQVGPRYLHSTGQAFKGGKNNGHFLILTGPYFNDLHNNQGIKFSSLHLSQALGDTCALIEQGRHILHINVGQDYHTLTDIAGFINEIL
jgi:transaldolase/glucose-6-phosphate isomerase